MGHHFGNLVVTAGTAGFRHDNLLSYDTVDIMMTPGFSAYITINNTRS